MKKLFTFALLFVLATGMAWAQNEKYTTAMTDGINALMAIDRSKPDPKTLQDIGNRFERIAAAEPKEWLPKYYAAYSECAPGIRRCNPGRKRSVSG
jgi:hypothetical protein